ncbi:hypothetical protein llap_9341 [Limosa lapponica baueri]|uniref:Uncharacterized protein n=1 Tax=Limosa lapponica baueri TaxID=1758121 RepID=A0A2I0U2X2_LIMLA|nr:hypothetical protein llap_9341 [Limosa lapponica baueri]
MRGATLQTPRSVKTEEEEEEVLQAPSRDSPEPVVAEVLPLQTMKVCGVADIHLQPMEDTTEEQDIAGPHGSQSGDEAVNPATIVKDQDLRITGQYHQRREKVCQTFGDTLGLDSGQQHPSLD